MDTGKGVFAAVNKEVAEEIEAVELEKQGPRP